MTILQLKQKKFHLGSEGKFIKLIFTSNNNKVDR